MSYEEAGSASSHTSEKSLRSLGCFALALAVSSLLLTAPSASAAPAGGNGNSNGGNDHHAFRVVDKNGNLDLTILRKSDPSQKK